jgi:hypothetical protein
MGKQGGLNYKDEIKSVYPTLKVLERVISDTKLAKWKCLCECGKEFIAVGTDLRNGKTKTCGCRISIKNRRNWSGYEKIPQTVWSNIVRNAEQRNIEVKIAIEYINELFIKQDGKCYFTNLDIYLDLKEKTASLDRLDNTKGYVEGNVAWVHKDINKMKGMFPADRFIELCNLVSENKK